MDISVKLDAAKFAEANAKMPGVVEKNVDPRLGVVAARVARDAKLQLADNGSMAFSNLADSIISRRLELLRWQVSTGVNHARAVEEGTGPAVGKKAYWPDSRKLEPYVKLRAKITFSGKPGSPKRASQLNEIRERAQALARHIRKHGTKPHPYMAPAAEKNRSGATDQVALGVAAGLKEVFGA